MSLLLPALNPTEKSHLTRPILCRYPTSYLPGGCLSYCPFKQETHNKIKRPSLCIFVPPLFPFFFFVSIFLMCHHSLTPNATFISVEPCSFLHLLKQNNSRRCSRMHTQWVTCSLSINFSPTRAQSPFRWIAVPLSSLPSLPVLLTSHLAPFSLLFLSDKWLLQSFWFDKCL